MDTRTLALDEEEMLAELGLVRRVALRLLGDSNDADDVVQEAWLRTRTAPVRFESRGRLRAWLAALAHRMARDTLRARRRRLAREERAARLETEADAADVLERSALLERLLQAVRALEEPQRSTVLLRYLDGHSTAEIAAAMSVSEDVVRKRLTRTRAHLRTALGLDEGREERARTRRRALQVATCAGLLAALAGWYLLGATPEEPVPTAGVAVTHPEALPGEPASDELADDPALDELAIAAEPAAVVAETPAPDPVPLGEAGAGSGASGEAPAPAEHPATPALILSAPD